MIFSDVEILERRLAKQSKAAHNNKEIAKECELIKRLIAFLEDGNLAKNFEFEDDDEAALAKEYNLLTAKPVIFAANVTEDDLADDGAGNKYVQAVRDWAKNENYLLFVRRLNRKYQSLMMMKRKCSLKTLESAHQVLISLWLQVTDF